MPTQVQFRRGTTAQNNSFTGAVGELSIDTDKDALRIHDGTTSGGFEQAKVDLTNVSGATNLSLSGITTTNSLSIGSTQVISSARQLQNIASLDATTTATIESAVAAAPNDFTSLNISGISTLNNVVVGGATTALIVNGNARVTGILTVGTSSLTLDGINDRITVGTGLTITSTQIIIGSITIGSGSLTGTATSTTNIPNLTGAITSNNTTTSLGSFSSSDLSTALTDETGSGAAVFATSPTLVTPALGSATATSIVVGSGVTINASGIVASAGIITASQLSTGASGTGINITTNTISGPATLTIDPAAVGDNTGAVRIKGDLFVDGTQFIVNSTTIELADFVVGIASTATTDALADGAGIKIGPDNTLTYDHTNTSLKSSENFNVASGKTYKINGTDVLSATTLGSAVVNSSLTSVGTLTNLNVGNVNSTGIITATTIELGHATDTTLARSAAGVVTIEGVEVVTLSRTQTLTNKTLTSPTLTTPALGTPASGTLTSCTGLPLTTGVTGTLPVANGGTGIAALGTGVATFLGTPSSANLISAVTDETGSGALVFATSPTLVTPALGTPSSGTLTSCTGLPITGITSSTTIGLGVGSIELGHATDTTITRVSAGLVAIEGVNVVTVSATQTLTNKTLTSPTLTTPALGTPSSGTLTSCTGLPLTTGVTGTLPVANGGTGVTASTGTGSVVLSTSPTLVTPLLGTPTSGNLANCTFPTLNQNTSGSAATLTTGRTIAITGDLTYTSPSFNGSGNVTAAGTLATVNANVGTFGSGGAIPTITVNAKGLITGVTTTAVTSGTTITDDTSTNASRFLTFTSATSGSISAANVSSTKLTFNPSTGALSATDFNSTSDINLKDNIQTIVNPLDKIIKLNGVTFNWKENQKPSIGVIAQELEKVLPELVTQGDIKTVNYNGLIGVLIEAVKEQQKQIDELKAIIKNQ